MSFNGWPEEALEFYEGLAADNSKTYWTRHKAVYEEKVLGPMTELLEDLADEFGRGKLFRPYRDIRFSKDKSPYKTHIAATLGSGYLQFSAAGMSAGAGMYEMSADQLDRFRRAVDRNPSGADLEDVVARIEKQGITVQGHGELKTAPRGYPADHPRIGLLRCKGLVAWQDWPVQPWMETAQAAVRVTGFFRAVRPLRGWLDSHVGQAQRR
ncbi:MAG TPA: DUF2461 domain-containing protein [Streptosporangiaceae bacterium]|jgi:uncharacterized protein (TIGR02453 family)|nr:DUF2461 domain-containing protein [Streptosporangiaceae bacterium]